MLPWSDLWFSGTLHRGTRFGPEMELRDGILWTTDDPVVACSYIPRFLSRAILDIDYIIDTDHTTGCLVMLRDEFGLAGLDCGEAARRLASMCVVDGTTVTVLYDAYRVWHRSEITHGWLMTIESVEALHLADATIGGSRPNGHPYDHCHPDWMTEMESCGYDGVLINDGNAGRDHTSAALFRQGLGKVRQAKVERATHHGTLRENRRRVRDTYPAPFRVSG